MFANATAVFDAEYILTLHCGPVFDILSDILTQRIHFIEAEICLTTLFTIIYTLYFQAFPRWLEPREQSAESAEAERQHEPHPVPQQRRAEDRLRRDGPRLRDGLPATPEGAAGPGFPGEVFSHFFLHESMFKTH